MITDLFDTNKYTFNLSDNLFRINNFEGFIERIEDLDNGISLLYQINKSHDRYFVTFCADGEEICYVSVDQNVDGIFFYRVTDDGEGEDEITKSELFEMIEERSQHFVLWFLFNVVGIETKQEWSINE